MNKSQLFCIILIAIGFLNIGQAQVVLNEYSASNLNSFFDNHEKTEDWIELYNMSDTPIDLSGYHLSDKDSKPEKWDIPEGTIIPAKGYLTFWCSGRDTLEGAHFHTNFKLSQTEGKDEIVFANPTGDIIEMTKMITTLVEHSICKEQDGSDNWMICVNPTLSNSNNGATKFSAYTVAPSMDMEAGFYNDSVTVQITNNEPNSVLRYTLDGRNPSSNSPIYSAPIRIDSTTVLKARSFSNDVNVLPGKMDFNTYFIDEDFSVAVFSVAADNVKALANGNGTLIPIGSIEYFDKSKEREAISFGSLNRHGQDSWVLDHRSIDWVSRDEMGYSKAIKAPLFAFSERDEYQKFMFRNSGDDNYPSFTKGERDNAHVGSTHIRDEYVQTLAYEGGMKLDVRHVERVVLFLNGEYWGLYGLRDRPVDHDYTDYYYDQDKYDLHYLTTWGRTQAQYGELDAFNDWYQLRDFILENDMSEEDNYEKVDDELNTTSLIDYMIANLNVVAVDWLNYNTGWWRGLDPDGEHKKWGYILWDLDATFDYYINYTGVPNQNPDAQPCDLNAISLSMDDFFTEGDLSDCQTIQNGTSPYMADDTIFQAVINQKPSCCWFAWDQDCQDLYDEIDSLGVPEQTEWVGIRGNIGKHEKIFLKLLDESPEFKQLYYSRYADLMNTVYSCENMLETLDKMVSVIESEMPKQIERWGGDFTEWQNNIIELKDFVIQRCELLDDGLETCYELEGPYMCTIMTEPSGVGEIKLNTLEHQEDLPWTGAYFGNMEQLVRAKSINENFEFSHWESTKGTMVIADSLDNKTSVAITAPDTLIAVFDDLSTSIKNLVGLQNLSIFPNPTNGRINIQFELTENSKVGITLLDAMSRKLKTLSPFEKMTIGEYSANYNLDEYLITQGIYVIEIRIDNQYTYRKLIILR